MFGRGLLKEHFCKTFVKISVQEMSFENVNRWQTIIIIKVSLHLQMAQHTLLI